MEKTKVNSYFELTRDVVRKLYPSQSKVFLHEPQFVGNEWEYVKECIDTGWVSSAGSFVDKFEKSIEDYTGSSNVVSTVNGTAALHIALKVGGVMSGDEVLMPSLTFVATANAVSYCGATPHFTECEDDYFCVDPDELRAYLKEKTISQDGFCVNKDTGKIIRALIVVHVFGHPARMDELVSVCDEFNLLLVEDAAEALGTYYKNRHVGTFGDFGVLSFNGNKIITSGGGGAVLTNNSELARKLKHVTTTAKSSHPWEFVHDEVGYNYRLPNLNAALGLAQLENLDIFLSKKRQLAHQYRDAFNALEDVRFVNEPQEARSNYWLNTLHFKNFSSVELDDLLSRLHQEGIHTRPSWKPMHFLPMYENCPKMNLQVTESVSQKIMNLPSSVGGYEA